MTSSTRLVLRTKSPETRSRPMAANIMIPKATSARPMLRSASFMPSVPFFLAHMNIMESTCSMAPVAPTMGTLLMPSPTSGAPSKMYAGMVAAKMPVLRRVGTHMRSQA